jgi:phospholipase A-2-activating protein
VVSGEGSGSTKKEIDGKQYDYVFDIDIEEGKPPLKLPYNLTESPWDAARKFLDANKLPMTYYEQVSNWISDNTKGASIGQSSAPAQQAQARDPWGTERRYRPGDVSSGAGGRKLPQRSFVSIVEGNPANAIKIIVEKAQSSGDLTPDEIAALQKLPDQLQNKNDPHPTTQQTEALLKVATTWQQKARVPAVGVLAVLAVSPAFIVTTCSGDKDITNTLFETGIVAPKQESANNVVHGIRLLVNLFKTESGRLIVDGTFDQTLQFVRPFASEPESLAQAKALATLYLNYAVQLVSQAPSEESKTREARAEVLMRDIAFMLESDSPHAGDGDALHRTLAALGTLITLGNKFRQRTKMGISGTLHVAGTKPAAQRQDIKDLMAEIRDELR